MNNNYFFNLIELIKTYKKISFYIILILFGIIFFFLKQYILTSIILVYTTEKILKKYENKMKLRKFATGSLILGTLILIGTIFSLILKKSIDISNIFFLIFSSLFVILLAFYYIVCFLIYYFKYQFQSKNFLKAIKESLKLILFLKKNKYSDFFNEFTNLIFINSVVVTLLIWLVSLFHESIPDITEIINERYILSYLTVLIVKIIDFLKEKVFEIE